MPPTSIMAQPGLNSVLLTWSNQGSIASNGNCSVVISRDTESNVIAVLPPGSVQYTAPAVGGATPPVYAWYLAYRNPCGLMSRQVQIKGSASPQTDVANPPANPAPPPGAGNYGGGSNPGGYRNPKGL